MIIRQIPENVKLIYSKEDLAYSVYKMAGKIRHWVKDTHTYDGQQYQLSVFFEGVFSFSRHLQLYVEPHSAER